MYEEYLAETSDQTPTVIASTANPYKFSKAVLLAVLGSEPDNTDEFAQVDQLISVTGESCPPQLATLKEKTPRFTDCCNREDMAQKVYQMLGIDA